ncbi:MAG: hypothetical protein M3137_02560 [Actinomycetota bacterium]|nr:hypothetical protein [Actinomycetota bacterium]
MSQLDDMLSRSSCSQCGANVFMTGEGRVACQTCEVPTEECTCEGAAKPDTHLPV